MKILVNGIGSIGKRHVKNLEALDAGDLVTCDPYGGADYTNLKSALEKEKPDAVFVCSPTEFHAEQAWEAAKSGAHVFIEKPLSHSLQGLVYLQKEVNEHGVICMVGCNMRFHHGPATVKKLLEEGVIGKPSFATVYTGSFLPSWRPTQNYLKSYSADPLQGGAILDCIHEIDLALWYLGPATLKNVTKLAATPIDLPKVEGTADLDLAHTNGAESRVHLSFMEKTYRRFCSIEGDKGSIEWNIGSKKVEVLDPDGEVIATHPEPEGYDINQMYVDELKHFLACIAEKRTPMGNLDEATRALEIALEAKKA